MSQNPILAVEESNNVVAKRQTRMFCAGGASFSWLSQSAMEATVGVLPLVHVYETHIYTRSHL